MTLKRLDGHFTTLICEPEPERRKRGRPRINAERVTTNLERAKSHKNKAKAERHQNIAVLDTETDPFDNMKEVKVFPFTACLYSDQFEPIFIWELNRKLFVEKVIAVIEGLPGKFTIYAHNGGKFDFMFLIHKMRGKISFKGRGIMAASIGNHELRDSYHLIPEKLAAYQKDVFDYSKLLPHRRGTFKDEIQRYMLNDCIYLFDLVRKFVNDFGLKLSIGQAAMGELKKHYQVERFSDGWDAMVRQFYFGGRVECIRGAGRFSGNYKLVDVNSHYPNVMANKRHPIGSMSDYRMRIGPPSNDTVFVDLTCTNNGALIGRDENGATTARMPHGRFRTTIHEYETALKYGLISDVQIHYSFDCAKQTDFSNFIVPMYAKRQLLKRSMKELKERGLEQTQAFVETKKDDIFLKFLLNNSYGKFATNPRRFKEHFITDPDQLPPETWFKTMKNMREDEKSQYMLPEFEGEEYWIWSKPNPMFTFYNVGTAASITGAARAELLEALQLVTDPIYCDTDSIICKDTGSLRLHNSDLGAWDLEDEFTQVVIAGKKLYSVRHKSAKKRSAEDLARGLSPDFTVKSKGTAGLTENDLLSMLAGETITMRNFGPTLTRRGRQDYIKRKIRITTPLNKDFST